MWSSISEAGARQRPHEPEVSLRPQPPFAHHYPDAVLRRDFPDDWWALLDRSTEFVPAPGTSAATRWGGPNRSEGGSVSCTGASDRPTEWWPFDLLVGPMLGMHHWGDLPQVPASRAFPFRDPADPRWVDPGFANASGAVSTQVWTRAARLKAPTVAFLARAAGIDDVTMARLVPLLEADALSEMHRLVSGHAVPPRYEVRPLRSEDLPPHEQLLTGLPGLFAPAEDRPERRPTLGNGRILGLYMSTIEPAVDRPFAGNTQDPHGACCALALIRRGGSLIGLSGSDAPWDAWPRALNEGQYPIVTANTALLPGFPLRADAQRNNALFVPFDVQLTDATGRLRTAMVIALVALDRTYAPDHPTGELRVDYGEEVLNAFSRNSRVTSLPLPPSGDPSPPVSLSGTAPVPVVPAAPTSPASPASPASPGARPSPPRTEMTIESISSTSTSSPGASPAGACTSAPVWWPGPAALPEMETEAAPDTGPAREVSTSRAQHAATSREIEIETETETETSAGVDDVAMLDAASDEAQPISIGTRRGRPLYMNLEDWDPVSWPDPERHVWPPLVPAPADAVPRLLTSLGMTGRLLARPHHMTLAGALLSRGWHMRPDDLRVLCNEGRVNALALKTLWGLTSFDLDPRLRWLISQRPKRDFESNGQYLQRLQFCGQLDRAQFVALMNFCGDNRVQGYLTQAPVRLERSTDAARSTTSDHPVGQASPSDGDNAASASTSRAGPSSAVEEASRATADRPDPSTLRYASMDIVAELDAGIESPSGVTHALALWLAARRAGWRVSPPQLFLQTGTSGDDAMRACWLLTQSPELADFVEARPRGVSETASGYVRRLRADASPHAELAVLVNLLLPHDTHLGPAALPHSAVVPRPPQARASWRAAVREAGVPNRVLVRAMSRESATSPLGPARLLAAALLRRLPDWPLTTRRLQEACNLTMEQAQTMVDMRHHPEVVSLILTNQQRDDETDLAYAMRLHRLGMSRESACRFMFCNHRAFDLAVAGQP